MQDSDKELIHEARAWIDWALRQGDLRDTNGEAHGIELAERLEKKLKEN